MDRTTAELATFLGEHPPFDGLDGAELDRLASAARVTDVAGATVIMDAYARPTDELFVVLSGRVELWGNGAGGPDDLLGTGGVFGYSALLSGRAVGPRAVAAGPASLVVLPASVVRPAFASSSGARFLADSLSRGGATADPSYGVVDELITREPILVSRGTPVDEVARLMTERDTAYAAVDVGDGSFGLITDAVLRERVIAAGRPMSTPAGEVMTHPASTAPTGESAASALITLLDRHDEFLLVVGRDGRLRGAVAPADFAVSSTTAGVALRQQLTRAADVDELAARARRMPAMVADLLGRGVPTSKVIAVYTATIDAVVRRALVLTLGRHDLDPDAFTWLELGSNGRREAVLSSDVDSAVAFASRVDDAGRERYRTAVGDVGGLITRAGLHVDSHGATASRRQFSRSNAEWRAAAQRWLDDPVANQGAMMTSLMVDARPIHGDPGLTAVSRVFADLRGHPGTMRLLLTDSLSAKAKLRSVRDVLARRGGTFDVKRHALLPIINIARWAALSVGSAELSTTGRLRAASGSEMLPDDSATVLGESFEVLQRIRLGYQLGQIERGHRPSDVVTMQRLSPIDRSVIGQAVREISGVQRRMENVAHFIQPEEWV